MTLQVLQHILSEIGHNYVAVVSDYSHNSMVEHIITQQTFCVATLVMSTNISYIVSKLQQFPQVKTVIVTFTRRNLEQFLRIDYNNHLSEYLWIILSKDHIPEQIVESARDMFDVPTNILIMRTEHYELQHFRERMSNVNENLKMNPFMKEYHDWLYTCLSKEESNFLRQSENNCDEMSKVDFQDGFHLYQDVDDVIRGLVAMVTAVVSVRSSHAYDQSGCNGFECLQKEAVHKRLQGMCFYN